jgi:type VI secretion system ImpM family protein
MTKGLSHPNFYFGKLPDFSDFVRHNASGDDVRAFEQWIQEALYLASRHFDHNWTSVFRSAPAYHFLFASENQTVLLIGIFQPSHDKSERTYPFVVSRRMDSQLLPDHDVALIPLAFRPFFRSSVSLIQDGLKGLPLSEITLGLDGVRGDLAHNFATGSADFEDYLQSTPQDRFWSALFGDFENPQKFSLIKNLFDILGSYLSNMPIRRTLGLRFPLGRDDSSRHQEVCFWMNVCLKRLGKAWLPPTIFWPVSEKDDPPYLFFFLAQPSPRALLPLIDPASDYNIIFKLEGEVEETISEPPLGLSFPYRPLLETRDLTLKDFLQKL